MLGRAAALVEPSADLQSDAPNLIASMLAAGYDQDAARWARAVSQMDDDYADQAWAMLALGSPDGSGVDLSLRRINAFIDRDDSEGHKRSALLVAGLAGLGRIDEETASRLSGRFGLRIGNRSPLDPDDRPRVRRSGRRGRCWSSPARGFRRRPSRKSRRRTSSMRSRPFGTPARTTRRG